MNPETLAGLEIRTQGRRRADRSVQRAADAAAAYGGSWTFIGCFAAIILMTRNRQSEKDRIIRAAMESKPDVQLLRWIISNETDRHAHAGRSRDSTHRSVQ